MDFLLLAVALLILLFGGFGLSLIVLPNRKRGLAELLGLSILLGVALVSSSLFIFGFLISGTGLLLGETALCLATGLTGLWRKDFPVRFNDDWSPSREGKLLFVVNVIQASFISWLGFLRVLGWDGLFNFEIKARLAFLNDGVLPLELLSDPSRSWTLQSYPLMLPMTENWLYLWLGRADQQLVKIIFPLFFIAALCLFNAGNRLYGVLGWRRFIASALVFTVPLLVIGDGSASSGYGDFPLAVFYLAAVIYLMEFWRSADDKALRLAGMIAAASCWLKQEGAILWLCVMALALVKLMLGWMIRSEWKELAKAAFPGLLMIFAWQAFVRTVSLPGINQFQPVGLTTLRDNLWRVPVIAQAVMSELIILRHWGVLWLFFAMAAVWILSRKESREFILLPMAVLLPMLLYSGVYVFSLWGEFITHLESSFPRLLIHVSLVAVLTIAVAARQKQIEAGSQNQT